VPSRDSPEEAIAILQELGYTACEIDFEGKFWMDYDWAERFGTTAREAGIVLSVHAPIAGFMGHAERGKKLNMAVGMLDHSAGVAKATGAELVVFHPGFLLGRTREDAIDSVVEQLGELRERLEKKDRAVPFAGADEILPRGAPFHIHFSDIAYANRNETKHLPYGEGTLRAEPLGKALKKFRRPATVISESPDVESSQAIKSELYEAAGIDVSDFDRSAQTRRRPSRRP
jgi:endonuclease IV